MEVALAVTGPRHPRLAHAAAPQRDLLRRLGWLVVEVTHGAEHPEPLGA
jgi:hypothetical protein